ncbi:restriction endonuclease [Radiobacillus deserti]|uniref:Restriction endonuclease n=1 Tax=Radiobacillus deserti TaxID=2594883 RepID=A0A516KJE8_9BACI|nr:restriction endonuclease [Radiobacillus deserti]QDP41519.1 restriction endonuclease [Radiobacillus deserti]
MKQLLNMSIIFLGLLWFWKIADNPSWYWFFIILLAGVIIPEVIFPSKKKKKSKGNPKANSPKVSPSKKGKTDKELLTAKLEDLNGSEFERLVALYYKEKGYEPRIVGGSGDHEVDLILTDPKEKYKIAVQCKHWRTKNVGNDVILRLSSGKRVHKCLDAWCITTSNYTKSAREAAEGLNIRLLNGLHVQDQIDRWRKNKKSTL